jgi:hypothetical protein
MKARWLAASLSCPSQHNGRPHAGAEISCENVTHEKRIESHKHSFKRMAGSREWLAGIVPMFEQLFRFLNFGEILSGIEIDKDWCEHL